MYEMICSAFIIGITLLVGGILVVALTGQRKTRVSGVGVIVVSAVVITASVFWGVSTLWSENIIDPLYGGNVHGSAAALYRYPTVIPADNGSVYVAWSSNAGAKYTTYESYSHRHGYLNIAKIDPSGKVMSNKRVDPQWTVDNTQSIANSRFQDGYLFLGGGSPRVLDSNGNVTTSLPSTRWMNGRIYHLPGGPLLFPWDVEPIHGGISNNALTDPDGNITFISGSLYQYPFSGTPVSLGNDLSGSVINGTGKLLVNQTLLPTIYRWLRVPASYRMALDPSGRPVVACVAGPDWQQDNTMHIVLNLFDKNLSLATNISVDQPGSYFESLQLLDLHCTDEAHYSLLLVRTYSDPGNPNTAYTKSLDLIDVTAPEGESPRFQAVNLVTAPSKSNPSGVMGPDGETVFVTHFENGELWLKFLDPAGKPRFKDVRLTPTDDSYSWNYPSNW